MSAIRSVLYSPYGAYEQKAMYQRNFMKSTISVVSGIVFIYLSIVVIGMLTADDTENIPVVKIKTIAELGPPPSVAKRPPQVQVQQPQVVAPKIGIPKPVADEEVIDEDIVLATRDEMADIVAPDIMSGSGDVVVEIEDNTDYIPAPGEFVAVEIYPEMIYKEQPEYPRLAKQAGLEGKVVVQVLVSETGEVLKAQVADQGSSKIQSLDEAAVAAAYKNKFKPAIQNGKPIKLWVTYDVDFKLSS